jgi:DNA-directed RNA polymerase subunit F
MEERQLTLAEVKELLEKEGGKRELNEYQKFAAIHAQQFSRLDGKTSRKLVDDLVKVPQMTEQIACKIADVLPQSPDELRAVLMKERFTLESEAVEAVLEAVRKYL